MASIGSLPASAAERSVALHIIARRIVVLTSLLLVILFAVRSLPSITASESPVRSSKNGMLCTGAASDASASNCGLCATIPLWKSALSSIVRLIT